MPSTLTTCTACGCTCDDIRLSIDAEGSVGEAANACEIGRQWFALPSADGPVAMIEGKEATLEDALARAVEILSAARLPLVTGLQHATTEAIRAAVALADQVGACVDWTASDSDAASTLALQSAGSVTATLGEVAQRADMVVVWGLDLATTHPRHFERYSLEPTSQWISGRADRTPVVIDPVSAMTAHMTDEYFQLAPNRDYEALVVLRSLLAGIPLDAAKVQQQTGVPLTEWQELVDKMKQAKFGSVIHGGSLSASRESLIALTQLMADLTAHTRWVAVPAGSAGNKSGAASVLTWQTGYPLGVSLAEGYPQYGPGEWTTKALLDRGEANAALLVGSIGETTSIPTIALDWQSSDAMNSATVAIRTARPGVECSGTTQRADGVMLPMRAARTTDAPTTEEVLERLKKLFEK
ncbi:formylmethanofuran dehydrogenase subunit B [Aeoliella sp.]|uniref:formylmethanofuran dehydrogenase subunit B n=1 Tax=Aeoliella sp. TaxID=2795800 RepID=UPI003CCBB3AC